MTLKLGVGCPNLGVEALAPVIRRDNMHPNELMKPDLLSEIVLLTFGMIVLSSVALVVVAAIARS